MLAFVYHEDSTFSIDEVKKPEPSDDALLCKVNIASICGTDVRAFFQGNKSITRPRIMGHEGCYTVEHAGKAFDSLNLSKGERIFVAPALGCGECKMCRTGHSNMCSELFSLGYKTDGCFAEYISIPKQFLPSVFKLDGELAKLSDASVALSEPVACALNAQSYLSIEDGCTVAVFGAGFIGCMHAELAYIAGAKQVFLIEPSDDRREDAKRFLKEGTVYLTPKDGDINDQVRALTDGEGVDVAIVACSVGPAHTDAQRIAAKLGRISLFGGLPGESIGFLDSNLIHYNELGVFGSHATTNENLMNLMHMVASGKLDIEKYVSAVRPLSEMMGCFDELRSGKLRKVLIKP